MNTIPEPEPIVVPEPILDVALLRKAVEWAEAEAAKAERGGFSEWEQCTWMSTDCGTTYCIAGYICALNEDQATTQERFDYFREVGEDDEDIDNWDGEPAHLHWSIRAAELLGVSTEDTTRLFYGLNGIGAVRVHAEVLVKEFGAEGERL